MAAQELSAFVTAARACVQAVADNASYIEAHWREVNAPPPHAQAVQEMCWRLIEAWESMHSDLTDLEISHFPADSVDAQAKAVRVHGALDPELPALNATVTALRAAADDDERFGLGYMLVAESATNILHAHAEMALALNAYADALGL